VDEKDKLNLVVMFTILLIIVWLQNWARDTPFVIILYFGYAIVLLVIYLIHISSKMK